MSRFMIEDGTGSGNKVAVNDSNKLQVYAVQESVEHYHNHAKNTAYKVVVQQTPTGANDCFFHLKNTSSIDIILEGLYLRVASAETLEFKINDAGTSSGGTTSTPINLASGSGNVPTATIEAGNDITGLSGGSTFLRYFATSTETGFLNFEQDLVLNPSGSLTIYAVTGSVQVDATVTFYTTKDD